MKALLLGLIVIAAAVAACLPMGLGWWDEVLVFLKGFAPVLAVLIGIVAIFIGIADLKDRTEAKKENPQDNPAENK